MRFYAGKFRRGICLHTVGFGFYVFFVFFSYYCKQGVATKATNEAELRQRKQSEPTAFFVRILNGRADEATTEVVACFL